MTEILTTSNLIDNNRDITEDGSTYEGIAYLDSDPFIPGSRVAREVDLTAAPAPAAPVIAVTTLDFPNEETNNYYPNREDL